MIFIVVYAVAFSLTFVILLILNCSDFVGIATGSSFRLSRGWVEGLATILASVYDLTRAKMVVGLSVSLFHLVPCQIVLNHNANVNILLNSAGTHPFTIKNGITRHAHTYTHTKKNVGRVTRSSKFMERFISCSCVSVPSGETHKIRLKSIALLTQKGKKTARRCHNHQRLPILF